MNIGSYKYGNLNLSGTPLQPHMLNVFVRSGDKDHQFSSVGLVPSKNYLGYLVGFYSAGPGIVEAVKKIFSSISFKPLESNCYEFWIGVKNLFRRLIELIPICGLTMLLFDSAAMNLYYIPKIQACVKDPVVGIAINGNVIYTLPQNVFDEKAKKLRNPLKDLDRLDIMTEITKQTLQIVANKDKPLVPVEQVLSNAYTKYFNYNGTAAV